MYWEAHNTELLRTTWGNAIRLHAPAVHIITWNDFSENTQIEPSVKTQYLYYDLTAYFVSWYHTGHAPPIRSDAIYYSARSWVCTGNDLANGQDPMRLAGPSKLYNEIEMLALLTAPSVLEISVGNKTYTKNASNGLQVFRAGELWKTNISYPERQTGSEEY